ncbi:hypothetical protein LUZ61_014040 [Rhynchospora tenuis]|uniref:Leucine-rich repeat-containing N-terminal plant-type domain-containing protein n=1 Tax=Rhynchospora tenuis TaxID=198213 RepID=A0AAD5Z316_9POAL|nr:hypothetical protein LUZ61_014040 [Rhynchospora tenuis]
MVTHALFCLLQYILLFCTLSAKAGDVDLLISFKNSLPYPNILSNWNRTNAMCEFQGITCKSGHVSSLTIRGLPLRADFMNSVSAYILPLMNLETLTLHSTNLTGSISGPVNCTVRLKELDISSNNLKGSVSNAASLADSCPSLQSLNLSDNFIGHAFYSFSPVLPHLKMLDLSYNKIRTNKDLEWLFSKVGLLKYLDLSNNNIQDSLGSLTNLQYLIMWQNNLNGEISGLSLSDLDLSNNRLSGPIPELGSLATFSAYAFENNSGLCGLPLPPCNGGSISKGDVLQQSSTNHESSQGWWITLVLLFTFFLIIGFVIGQFIK